MERQKSFMYSRVLPNLTRIVWCEMKELFSVFRLAITVLALPLMATAAVSAHQYFANNEPISFGNVSINDAPTSVLAGTFRNHAIAIDAEGVVKGRIGSASMDSVLSGLSNVKVFFIRDGKVAFQGYSSDDGSFEAVGLEPGAYSFVATSAKGFAAFGVRLTDNLTTATNNIIEVATISPDFEHIVSILGRNLPTAVLNDVKANESNALPAAGSNRVAINNGKLNGNLFSLLNIEGNEFEKASVHLIREKKVVGKSSVGDNGEFYFDNVEPGIYEFVAKGAEGIAALSFEAVQQEAVPAVDKAVETIEPAPITAQTNYASPSLDVAPTVLGDSAIVNEQFGNACDACTMTSAPIQPNFVGSEVGCGVAAGGCCGSAGNWGGCSGGSGGCGGGGFGGLGGGLASLGRFAVLGWILTELFKNIDFNNNNNDGPVSPAAPA